MDSTWARLIEALLTLAGTAALIWWQMPPSQQQMIILETRSRAHRALHRAARASGRLAMGRELAGTPERLAGYDITLRLSELRDRM